jgi:capsular exopolysaccharide synthesis family protein
VGLSVDPVLRYRMRLRRELTDVKTSLSALEGILRIEQDAARSLDNYIIKDEAYRKSITRMEELYNGTVKRLKEINLIHDVGGFDAKTLARPGIGVKVAPSLSTVLFSGGVFGLLCGCLLAFLADRSDKGFRTPDEIRRRLGLPVLGHIPVIKPDEACRQKARVGQHTLDPHLIAHYRPRSVEAEAYRAVRTALYFSTQGSGHQLIQVTSPDQGDGKSLTITNLAISIAQSGQRVILVDADLRRPRQHKVLGMPASPVGVASIIAGQARLEDAVVATAVPNLSLLGCGPRPSNPAELLTSPQFQALLADLRERYDFVLVDTPPLLVVTDPCVVAPRVDGVMLVIRPSKKSGPQSQRAREILATLGAHVLGVIVNGASGRLGTGQYEYSYGPGNYSYEPDENEDKYYEEDPSTNGVAPAGMGPS